MPQRYTPLALPLAASTPAAGNDDDGDEGGDYDDRGGGSDDGDYDDDGDDYDDYGPLATGFFNLSCRSSNCDDGEMQDMHSDISIEDDVIDLNNKVRHSSFFFGLFDV